jgi:hypothetical protein
MNAKRSGKSRAFAWTLGILMALPVLYVLSVPLLWAASLRNWGSHPPDMVLHFATPYVWIEANTPLGPHLKAYSEWCLKWAEMSH